MGAMTRGPLSPAVYWRRRLLLVGLALLLVVGFARLLGGGSDASDQGAAVPTGATPTSRVTGSGAGAATDEPTGESTAGGQQAGGKGKSKGKQAKPTKAPALPEPSGTCADSDVRVRPIVDQAVAGRAVTITLRLRTLLAAACTWEVSPSTVTLKVTSGEDDIWSTRLCPRAMPTREVVLRSATTTDVPLTWGGRRADDTCSRTTAWAMPGWYHVAAAALAGEPHDTQFELSTPTPTTITASPTATPGKSGKSGKRD